MALFKKKQSDLSELKLPEHIGIIMDGNGRWAKKRHLPRSAGHNAGGKTFRTISRYCSDIGIKYLTVYAFSTENWRRPKEEIDALMKLFKDYLEEALRDFKDDSIVVRFIGEKNPFSDDLKALMLENEEGSKGRDGMVLNIAMNYGSRDELVRAVKKISSGVKNGDLIIRPSGEYRISNFMLWQSAYTEFVIMNKLWPDFSKEDLDEAIRIFNQRNRRFGGV